MGIRVKHLGPRPPSVRDVPAVNHDSAAKGEQVYGRFSEREALLEGIENLQNLAQEEYRVDLNQLLQEFPSETGTLRYTRLLGVMLKEPFASPANIAGGSRHSGAYRGWKWEPDRILRPGSQELWQYRVIQALYNERFGRPAQDPVPDDVLIRFVQDEGATENRLSLILLRSIHQHVCGNETAKANIEEGIEEARRQGVSLTNPTPQALIPSAGLGVCGIIMTSVPFGPFLGPLAGGLTIMVLNVGIDTFCTWLGQRLTALRRVEEQEQRIAEAEGSS
jgi:hypothetical protein